MDVRDTRRQRHSSSMWSPLSQGLTPPWLTCFSARRGVPGMRPATPFPPKGPRQKAETGPTLPQQSELPFEDVVGPAERRLRADVLSPWIRERLRLMSHGCLLPARYLHRPRVDSVRKLWTLSNFLPPLPQPWLAPSRPRAVDSPPSAGGRHWTSVSTCLSREWRQQVGRRSANFITRTC